MQRVLLTAGAIAPPFFVAAWLVEGALRPGYSSWSHYVSQLSLGPGGGLHVVAFVATGALELAFAWGAWRATRQRGGAIALALYGAAMIAAGAFPTDPAFGYPPGAPEAQTATGAIHGVAGIAAFVAVAIACFAFARAVPPRAFGIAAGVGTLAFFVASNVVAQVQRAAGTAGGPVGFLQRVSVLAGQAFLFALALRMLTATAPASPAARPSA